MKRLAKGWGQEQRGMAKFFLWEKQLNEKTSRAAETKWCVFLLHLKRKSREKGKKKKGPGKNKV